MVNQLSIEKVTVNEKEIFPQVPEGINFIPGEKYKFIFFVANRTAQKQDLWIGWSLRTMDGPELVGTPEKPTHFRVSVDPGVLQPALFELLWPHDERVRTGDIVQFIASIWNKAPGPDIPGLDRLFTTPDGWRNVGRIGIIPEGLSRNTKIAIGIGLGISALCLLRK